MASSVATSTIRQLTKLYVGNISWTVNHLDLKQYFSRFGHVQNAVVVFDKNTGLSRCYGFVTFSNKEGFQSASQIKDHQLEGMRLVVEPAQ